jgi:hypothetical protein
MVEPTRQAKRVEKSYRRGRLCTLRFKGWMIYVHLPPTLVYTHTYTVTLPTQHPSILILH